MVECTARSLPGKVLALGQMDADRTVCVHLCRGYFGGVDASPREIVTEQPRTSSRNPIWTRLAWSVTCSPTEREPVSSDLFGICWRTFFSGPSPSCCPITRREGNEGCDVRSSHFHSRRGEQRETRSCSTTTRNQTTV